MDLLILVIGLIAAGIVGWLICKVGKDNRVNQIRNVLNHYVALSENLQEAFNKEREVRIELTRHLAAGKPFSELPQETRDWIRQVSY